MALEEVSNFGPTGYTNWHGHASTTTVNVDSILRIRNGPGTGYAQVGQHSPRRVVGCSRKLQWLV